MRLLQNIVRCIQWLPVIWRDVDWDYSGLLDIIDYKVARMRQLHLTKSHGTQWSQRVNEMDQLRHLIALSEEDPEDEWDAHYYSGVHSRELDKPCGNQRECKHMLDLSGKRAQRNWRNLWRYLEKHLQGWWD